MQILAGNARKVGTIRFERMKDDVDKADTKKLTRLVPRIMKRRGSGDDDSDHSNSKCNEISSEDDYTALTSEDSKPVSDQETIMKC